MGLRRGELVGLRWADVDMDRGTLRIQQTVQWVAGTLYLLDAKTEDSEGMLPLPEWTWRVLLKHKSRQAAERAALSEIWQDFDLVFPSERGTPIEPTNLSRAFARLRDTAGLPGIRLHDLRHTVVSLLMEMGTPPHVVQAVARHADVKLP
jgi:integrase